MSRSRFACCWLLGLFAIVPTCFGCGCASRPKESSSAPAALASAATPTDSQPAAEMQAPQPGSEAAEATREESLAKTRRAPGQVPKSAPVVAPAQPADRSETDDAIAVPKRTSPASSGPKRKSAEASPAGAPGAAAPAFAEPPELRAAIQEFDAQWEQLSTSRACEDACRAFESMRRSAQRICDLVVASDPRQRCRTARDRLDQASRDLASRCTDCR